MGVLLGIIQSIPIMFDIVFTAAMLFTIMYVLIRLTVRLVPRLGRYEYRVLLVAGLLSLPMVFTVAGSSFSALLYRIQPYPYNTAVTICIYLSVAGWASTAAVLCFRLLKEWWRLSRWVQRLPEDTDPVFREALTVVPAGRRVVLKRSGPGGVVASWGLWKRVVLVPDGFSGEYSDEERRLVYLHELSHLRRRDSWMLLLAAALRSIGWFTPAARRALVRIQEGVEIACDRAVLACAGVRSFRYAELILRAQAAQASLAPGFAGQRKTEVRARIEHIVGSGCGRPRWIRDGVAIAAFVAVVGGFGLIGYGIDSEYRRELADSMHWQQAGDDRVVTMPDGSKANHSLIFVWRGSLGGYAFGRAERIEAAGDDVGEAGR
ncbi:MAG: M56 family metallopeptidase [Planctomycetes bacterium]|nr:M56 family metallopeptidase [Planctomycetota bacterium]